MNKNRGIPRKDEIGHVYGRLVVISQAESNPRGLARWLCKCECGNEKVVNGDKLRTGATRSCGCLRNELVAALTRLPEGEIERRRTQPRQCSKCGSIFPPEEFKHLRHHWCRACERSHGREYANKHQRKINLRDKYGITEQEYDSMLLSQAGLCAICYLPPPGKYLNVDHNHNDGSVRGLLCSKCNRGIGQLDDDPVKVSSALAYLTQVRANLN